MIFGALRAMKSWHQRLILESQKGKCDEYGSSLFETTLAKSAEFITMTFPVITHKNWTKLNQEHKKKNIINSIKHQIEFCGAVNFQIVCILMIILNLGDV